jgi:hypothetical protein
LITLIIDARPAGCPDQSVIDIERPVSFFEICPIAGGLSLRVRATGSVAGTSNKPSLHDVR